MSEQEECVLCQNEVPPMKQSYRVSIEVFQRHVYVIDDVNSPEEAEQAAEEYYNDGEQGTVENKEVIGYDSHLTEKEETN